MSLHLLYASLEAVALFSVLLVAAHQLYLNPRGANARLLALICLNSACGRLLARHEYAYWIPAAYQVDVGAFAAAMDFARNLTPGVFMILCHSLFKDEERLPRTLLAAFAVQTVLDFPGLSLREGAERLEAIVFNVAPAVLQLCFLGAAVAWIVGGWRADLIEDRRRLRWIFLLLFGSLVCAMVLLERLLLSWSKESTFHVHIALSTGTALLSIAVLVFVVRRSAVSLVDPTPRTEPQPGQLRADQLAAGRRLDALMRLLQDERIYRENGLTIGRLAARMDLPEYRVRRLIHESLGFRNFNAMLHHYRLLEAKQLLSDPSHDRLPILTIALSVGYSSINPFNRAFRELTGQTPSEFRAREALPADSSRENLADC